MRRYNPVILWIFAFMLITACGPENIPMPTSVPTLEPTATYIPTSTPQTVTNETLEQASPALIRIVNTVIDSPPLNVFAGFSAIATNLGYEQFTEPTSFDAGDYEVKIQASGSAQNVPPLLSTTLTLPSGQRVMVLITGSPDQLSLSVLPDALAPLHADESIIHLVNALSDNTAITLRSSDTDLTAAVGTGRETFSPILSTGKVQLTFKLGDRTTEHTADLKPQTNTTFIVMGTADVPSIVEFDADAPSRIGVHAINAAADITSIDVYLNDELLNSNVDYGRMTERKNYASGQYTVRVYAAGADRNSVEPLIGAVISLQNGSNFAVALLGSASTLQLVAFSENLLPTEANRSRLSILNTIPDLPEVDVQTPTKPIRGIPTVFYGQKPTTMEVEPGNYNFLMSAIDAQNQRITAELAENVLLEAGYYYLYLITGRQDSKPLILSEKINTVALTEDGEPQISEESSSVRFVNAVDGQSLNFSLNGIAAVSGLNYGESSTFIQVTDKNVTIDITTDGQTVVRGQQEATFEANKVYTVVAYQSENGQITNLVIDDDNLIFDGNSPHIRFINASTNDASVLGLAFSEPDGTDVPEVIEPVITEEPTQDPYQPPTVFTLPFGVQKLVSDIRAGSVSGIILMANGSYDLSIIDSTQNQLILTLPLVRFSNDIHIDVIAYRSRNSDEVKAFTVIYPMPPA